MKLKYHKKGDLGIQWFKGNMDITDWELLDSKPYRSEVANWIYNSQGIVPTGLEDETWLSVSSEIICVGPRPFTLVLMMINSCSYSYY